MLASRRREINDVAERVRAGLRMVGTIPFDPELAVERLGGSFTTTCARDDVDAMIKKCGNGSFEVFVASEGARRRFSIAHEIGHLFLHMGYLTDEAKWRSIDEYIDAPLYRYGHSEEEFEAHEFAGALLMPRELFVTAIRENSKDRRVSLGPVAERFGVSIEAAKVRGQWLNLLSWDQ